jgi:hypothetical protein
MANPDTPRGFYNPQVLTGGPLIAGTYIGGTTKAYPGDAMKMDSGKVLPVTASDADIIGICAEYHNGTDGANVLIFDDLDNTTWEVQAEASSYTAGQMTQADVGTEVDIAVTTGDTVRLISQHEIEATTTQASVRILSIYANGAGESTYSQGSNDSALVNCKVRVRFVKFAHASTGS